MTRNLELVQGLIRTRRCSVQVNTVQDWSLGQLCCSDSGHSAGRAGGAVSGTAGWHRAMPAQGRAQPGSLGLKAFAVAKFTPILAFSADKQKTKSGRICR